MKNEIVKPQLSTPTTSSSTAATNISDDDTVDNHIIYVTENDNEEKDNKNNNNKKNMKSHFDEEFDKDFDEKNEMFKPYETSSQLLRRKVSETSTFVRDTVNYYYGVFIQNCKKIKIKISNDETGANRTGDDTFKDFFDRRTKEKEALYFNVFVSGILICIIGSILSGISASSPESSITYAVESIVGSFARVFGFCMVSVIPVNEFDLMEILVRSNKYYLRLLILFVLVVFMLSSTAADKEIMKNQNCFNGLVAVNAVTSVLFIIAFKPKITYRLILFLFNCAGSFFGIAIICLNLDAYYQSNDIFAFYAALVWALNSFLVAMVAVNDWRKKRYEFSLNFRLSPDASDIFRKKIDDKHLGDEEHWGATSLYSILYILFTLQMIAMFIRAIGYMYRDEKLIALYWFLAGVADILPMIAVLVVGEKKCFSLLARYYEYNIKTLQSDGECLSRLVSSSISSTANGSQSTTDSTRVFWIKRKEKSEKYDRVSSDKKNINKSFWMKGTPYELKSDKQEEITSEKVTTKYEGIKVIYGDDIGFYYSFKGTEPKPKEIPYDKVSINKDSFDEWIKSNFKTEYKPEDKPEDKTFIESVFDVNCPEHSYVVIRQVKKEQSKQVDLKSRATEDMRKLEWGNHSKMLLKRLLRQSPRDIGSAFTSCLNCQNREKERLYNLTVKVPTIKYEWDKIDYFVSHSWEDDCEQKWEALKEFGEEFFKKNKRYPTLWLDKVCIDQRNPTRALEVLPINIASSKKMLVLMSDTYLERLWCIWELFTLFSFCSKELAIERLEIKFLLPKFNNSGDKEKDEKKVNEIVIQNINEIKVQKMKDMILRIETMATDKTSPIESSHCFGPEEEYKLRNILSDIGFDTLSAALKQIAKALSEKMKKSLYDEVSEKLRIIMSSMCK